MDKRRLTDETVLVRFELPAAVSATTASVCGEFNDWTPTHQLQMRSDGSFRTEISLPVGERVRFRYLLDGQRWENDWAADDYVPNGLGQDDSVVDLTHPQGLPLLAHTLTATAVDAPDATAVAGSDVAGDATGVAPAEGAGVTATDATDVGATDATAAAPTGGAGVEAVAGEAAKRAARPGLLRRWWRWLVGPEA